MCKRPNNRVACPIGWLARPSGRLDGAAVAVDGGVLRSRVRQRYSWEATLPCSSVAVMAARCREGGGRCCGCGRRGARRSECGHRRCAAGGLSRRQRERACQPEVPGARLLISWVSPGYKRRCACTTQRFTARRPVSRHHVCDAGGSPALARSGDACVMTTMCARAANRAPGAGLFPECSPILQGARSYRRFVPCEGSFEGRAR